MSTKTSSGRGAQAHDPDCRYRKLYEGSQTSLNDMANKQADTLRRVAALRSGVLAAMKQHMPGQFAAAERQLGHKLGTRADQDSVVLAFLNAFFRESVLAARPAVAVAAPPGIEDLRQALAGVGVHVAAGTDLRVWAADVARSQPPGATVPAPASAPIPEPAHAAAPSGFDAPADYQDDWRSEDAWGGIPEDTGPFDGFGSPDSPDPEPVSWDLADLFGESSSTGAAVSDDPDAAAEALIEELYSTAPPAPVGPPAARTREKKRGSKRDVTAAVPAADVAPAPVEDTPAPVPAPAPIPEPEPAPAPAEPAPAPAPAPVASVPAPQPEPAGDPVPDPAPARTGSARTASAVLKPTLFPTTPAPRTPRAKRQASRVARVSADAPSDGPPDASPPVATERYGELLALVTQPKPVFMADLVRASGSPGLVTAWEQQLQDQGSASPIREIAPRSHHRERGALVVPYSQELRTALQEHGMTPWAECLEDRADRARLRGARLYETAVVLHRFSEEVISHKFSADVLSLRLNTPQGLTGVVMWLGADAPTGDGRASLTAAVGEMVSDRMVMLAVLTHETGARALERLAGVVAEDAATQGWRPTMPVVGSHSWDFASDGGASALAIL